MQREKIHLMKQIYFTGITGILDFKCFPIVAVICVCMTFFFFWSVCLSDVDRHVSSLVLQNYSFLQGAPSPPKFQAPSPASPGCYCWCMHHQDTVPGPVCSYWCPLYLINLVTTNQSASVAAAPYLSTQVARNFFFMGLP